MTYEEQREQEQKEAAKRFDKALTLITHIKIDGWRWRPRPDDHPASGLPTLVNDEIQGEIYFGFDWRDKTKLNISTQFPRDKQSVNHVPYGVRYPSINVSLHKTPEQVGKDIERRLLPEYLPILEKVRESIRHTETYLDKKAEMGAALKLAFPDLKLRDEINDKDYNGYKQNGSRVSLSGDGVLIECGEKAVDLQLRGLTLEQAKTLLAQLFDMKGKLAE